MADDFPKHVFEDVRGSDFAKYNKKGVSEDFVTENFKELGWSCFNPFDDTGVDLVARKDICPNHHTRWNHKPTSRCNICNSDLITITRFIQVKAREKSKKNGIEITIDSKDLRGDPRHVFLIYSDATNDFFLLPIFAFLRIFTFHQAASQTLFGVPAFRRENNRQGFTQQNNEFVWTGGRSNANFSKYINEKGLEIISNPNFDLCFDEYVRRVSEMKFQLLHDYSPGEELNFLLEKETSQIKKLDDIRDNLHKTLKKKKTKTLEDRWKKCIKRIKAKEKAKKTKHLNLINHYKRHLNKKITKVPDEIIQMRQINRQKFYKKNKKDDELIRTVNDGWKRFKGVEKLG